MKRYVNYAYLFLFFIKKVLQFCIFAIQNYFILEKISFHNYNINANQTSASGS